jgi:hypothetical protein
MVTLHDVVAYMDTIGIGRQNRTAWRYVAEFLLEATERNGSVAAVRGHVMTALTVPAI